MRLQKLNAISFTPRAVLANSKYRISIRSETVVMAFYIFNEFKMSRVSIAISKKRNKNGGVAWTKPVPLIVDSRNFSKAQTIVLAGERSAIK